MQDAFDFSEPEETGSTASNEHGSALIGWQRERVFDAIRARKAPDSIVVVTVNQRLSRHLTAAYAQHCVAAGDTWWETPDILPLANWFRQLHNDAQASDGSRKTRLSPLAAQLRWRRLVSASHASLLNVDAAATQAARAWRLAHTWRCLPKKETWLSDDAHAWRDWSQRYASGLLEDGLIDDATLPAHLFGLIASGQLPAPETLVLAGFLTMTPEIRELLDVVATAGGQVVQLKAGEAARPRFLSWRDDAEELLAVAHAVREHLDREPGANLGVVVPDLDARRDQVLRTFDGVFFPAQTPRRIETIGRPYDVSVGIALTDVPVVQAAIDALTLTWRGLDNLGVSRVLLSPHLLHAASDESGSEAFCASHREALERRLREQRARHRSLAQLLGSLATDTAFHKPLKQLSYRVRQDLPKQEAAGGAGRAFWAQVFADALKAFAWPGQGLSSEEYQAVQAFHGVLDDLESLDDGEGVSAEEALDDLRRLARQSVFQPETPELPVRILGRLESHGQCFDALWVVGMDSEQWPPQASPTPFLSIESQREAGLPEATPEARMTLAQKEFELWCCSAADVTMSCARQRDDKPLVPAAPLVNPECGDVIAPIVVSRIRDCVELERVDDMYGPPTQDAEVVRGGTRLLEDQAVCPFRAFARHRLGIRDLEEPELGLDPRQRGTFLHRAMELFWLQTRTQAALLDLDEEALEERVVESVTSALAEDPYIDTAIKTLETKRIVELLTEWLMGVEMSRTPFVVEEFEQKLEFQQGKLAVRLTLDRIDRVGDARVVIDYKTGKTIGTDSWAKTRIENPQLPLYSLTRDDIQGVAFARVVRGKCGFSGIAADESWLQGVDQGDPPKDWEAWRTQWRCSLESIADEISEGLAVAVPSQENCTYCELGKLCRVSALDTVDDDEVSV